MLSLRMNLFPYPPSIRSSHISHQSSTRQINNIPDNMSNHLTSTTDTAAKKQNQPGQVPVPQASPDDTSCIETENQLLEALKALGIIMNQDLEKRKRREVDHRVLIKGLEAKLKDTEGRLEEKEEELIATLAKLVMKE